jgi:hypothetical protein
VLGVVDGATFLAEPDEDVTWLVDGMLSVGGSALLVAKPKTGKSTFARTAAVAISQGERFLGRTTLAGPALYVTSEDKRDDVRRHLRRLGADHRLLVRVGPPDAADPIAWLREVIVEEGCRFAALDPLARFTKIDDANDYAKVTKATAPLIAVAHETGCQLFWVHHAAKGERVGIDASLGSTALTGFVDTILVLRRHGDGLRTLETIQRTGTDLTETVLRLDPHTGTLSLAGSVEAEQIRLTIPEILALLANQSLTEPEIREGIQRDGTITSKALRQAHADRQLIRVGAGVRGDPYHYSCPGVQPPSPSRNPSSSSSIEEARNGARENTAQRGAQSGPSLSLCSLRGPDGDSPPPNIMDPALTKGNACFRERDDEPPPEGPPEKPRRRRVRLPR